jgi:hypothetical protein
MSRDLSGAKTRLPATRIELRHRVAIAKLDASERRA